MTTDETDVLTLSGQIQNLVTTFIDSRTDRDHATKLAGMALARANAKLAGFEPEKWWSEARGPNNKWGCPHCGFAFDVEPDACPECGYNRHRA